MTGRSHGRLHMDKDDGPASLRSLWRHKIWSTANLEDLPIRLENSRPVVQGQHVRTRSQSGWWALAPLPEPDTERRSITRASGQLHRRIPRVATAPPLVVIRCLLSASTNTSIGTRPST
jgi:hypothetical protein